MLAEAAADGLLMDGGVGTFFKKEGAGHKVLIKSRQTGFREDGTSGSKIFSSL